MLFKGFIKTVSYAILAGLFLISILCIALPLYKYIYMSLVALIFFIIQAIIIYYLGERALKNPRSGAFLSVVVMNTFLKLIACFVFVFIYVKTQSPPDKLFLIPFLIFYLVFAAAETHFLSEQAKRSKVN